MENPNKFENKEKYENKEEGYLDNNSNYASNQISNFKQFVNFSNAIRELSYKVKIFFKHSTNHMYFLKNTSFQECSLVNDLSHINYNYHDDNDKYNTHKRCNSRFCKYCLLKKVK